MAHMWANSRVAAKRTTKLYMFSFSFLILCFIRTLSKRSQNGWKMSSRWRSLSIFSSKATRFCYRAIIAGNVAKASTQNQNLR